MIALLFESVRRLGRKAHALMGAIGSGSKSVLRTLDNLFVSWKGLVAFVAVIVPIAAWLVPQLGGGDDAQPTTPKASPALLGLVDATVLDEENRAPSHSGLEFVLHNVGGQLAVIDRAQLTIRRVYRLPLCYTQGDLPVSNTYEAMLPATAEPGDVVAVSLHQQIGPDEADRFQISIGIEAGEQPLDGISLFELDVALDSDSPGSPLRVGRMIVSLPEVPSRSHYYLVAGEAAELNRIFSPNGEPVEEAWSGPMQCWRSNTALIRRANAGSAIRSAELEAIDETMVTPTYAAFEASGG